MLRDVNMGDYEELKKLYKEFLVDLEEDTFLINPFQHILVYQSGGKLIAFLDYQKMYERSEISYIYVDPEFRNDGLAGLLINEMFERLIKDNVDTITLEVRSENKIAINFYEKHGFEAVGIRKNYYDGDDALLMKKKLQIGR